jgi:hypothetical protein
MPLNMVERVVVELFGVEFNNDVNCMHQALANRLVHKSLYAHIFENPFPSILNIENNGM